MLAFLSCSTVCWGHLPSRHLKLDHVLKPFASHWLSIPHVLKEGALGDSAGAPKAELLIGHPFAWGGAGSPEVPTGLCLKAWAG